MKLVDIFNCLVINPVLSYKLVYFKRFNVTAFDGGYFSSLHNSQDCFASGVTAK
jgi:hypothetical protein